jgi:hypothetical protein
MIILAERIRALLSGCSGWRLRSVPGLGNASVRF